MASLELAPLQIQEADVYWRVFLSGRSDVPSRSLQDHMDRYLALPPEERRAYFSIRRGDRIIGTVRLVEDGLTGFAMAPGHADDAPEALGKVIDLLRSRGATAITASFEERYEPAFAALGFRRLFARMRMEGPTRTYPARQSFLLKPPEEPEIPGLASFLQEAYEGHMEQAYGMHVGTPEEWRDYIMEIVKGASGRFMPDVSFVALDGPRTIGAILTTHWMGLPLLAELGVAKDRRGQGLGRALCEAASTRLAALGEARWSLYVTVGNRPAIRLYESLGFAQVGGLGVTARLDAP